MPELALPVDIVLGLYDFYKDRFMHDHVMKLAWFWNLDHTEDTFLYTRENIRYIPVNVMERLENE